MGRVIARRVLSVDGSPVIVEFGEPVPDPEAVRPNNPDYYCPVRISGLGGIQERGAYGVDSLQALFLAMKMTGMVLYSSVEFRGDRLKWFDGTDLGLPTQPGFLDDWLDEHIRPQLEATIDDLVTQRTSVAEFARRLADLLYRGAPTDALSASEHRFFHGVLVASQEHVAEDQFPEWLVRELKLFQEQGLSYRLDLPPASER